MTTSNPFPTARDVDNLDLDAPESLRSPEPDTYAAPEPVEPELDPVDPGHDPEYQAWLAERHGKTAPEKMAEVQRGPVIPDNAPRPQDRKAKADPVEDFDESEPVMDEATGILMVTIHHDGLELSIPADPVDWPILATRAFENGKIISAIEGLLTPQEFAKVLKKNYRNKEFGKLYEKLAKAGGFDNTGN